MNVGFIGLGNMGAPMVRRLLAAGHEVTVWNRTRQRAETLVAAGAKVADTPADAARGKVAVMTMLFDDAAHQQVIFGDGEIGLIEALEPDTLHISLSTISAALSEKLSQEHARRGLSFIAAPVFGRPIVAEEGKLWIVVAGADDAVAKARPLLEPMSRGISVIGKEPRQAHALKLGGNFLISAMIHSLSESFVYAEAQGIPPAAFAETINSALFQSPLYASYTKVMLNPPEHVGATIELGAKDLRLLREAAESRHVRLSLADELAEVFDQAKKHGLSGEDWAVGQYKTAQWRSGEPVSAKK